MLSDTRRVATLLGVAGLIPFAALALATIFAKGALKGQAAFALAAYGASILSFLGAAQWGFAIRAERARSPGALLCLGVLPSLVAWAALLLPVGAALIALGCAVLAALFVDAWSVKRGYAPGWWLPLRVGLSVGAGAALLLGGLFGA